MTSDDSRCPCGTGETYGNCCARHHRGQSPAPTAERLMRSRFSAFAVGDESYLLASWHPRTRPAHVALDDAVRWTRLEILDTERGGLFDDDGVVEFVAHYRHDGQRGQQQERSRFVRLDGHWRYLDAEG